jgi:hypothetical protein
MSRRFVSIAVLFTFGLVSISISSGMRVQEVEQTEAEQSKVSLFDGTFSGWEGDTENTWRIEDGTIIAGSMEKAAPRNEFLCTTTKYSDFELTLEFKTTGTEKINAGVQFRSELLRHKQLPGEPKPKQEYHEIIGYQADIGEGYHGCLYDESRRRKVLARGDEATDKRVVAAIPEDGWQTYRIRAVGDRVQLWLNGVQTVDYREPDESIWREGNIALQIHGNMVGTIAYRNIHIEDLSGADVTAASIDDMAWIAGHWTGEALGGQFEETWNPPMGGEMMGMFKLTKDGKVVFYELLTIVPEGDSFVLRLKHFGEKLVGWEEKEKSIEFPFVSATNKKVKFKGLTFSRDSKFVNGKIRIDVVVDQDGKQETLTFNCQRSGSP